MVDCLDGLGHDVVVGGHNDDTEVGHLGTTGTHGCERLVAGGIEECDMTAIGELDVVCADMLCDTPGFAGNHVGLADIVEQRGLTVVDMAHDGDNRRTGHEVFLIVLLLGDGLHHFGGDKFGLEAKFLGYDVDGLGVEALVDRHHHAQVHTCPDDLVDGHIHHRSEVIGGHELCQLQGLRLGGCRCCGCRVTLGYGFALLLAPFHTLLLSLVLGGQAGQDLLDLLLHILLVDLGVGSAFGVAGLSATVVSASVASTATSSAAIAAVTAISAGLVALLLDVDFLLGADALALLAVTVGTTALRALLLGDALVAALLLAFLAGTCRLVDGREVDFAYDIDCRTVLGKSYGEDFLLVIFLFRLRLCGSLVCGGSRRFRRFLLLGHRSGGLLHCRFLFLFNGFGRLGSLGHCLGRLGFDTLHGLFRRGGSLGLGLGSGLGCLRGLGGLGDCGLLLLRLHGGGFLGDRGFGGLLPGGSRRL